MRLNKVVMLWLPMVLIGMLNGTFRQVVLTKIFDSDTSARQVSSVLLAALLAIYISLIFKSLNLSSVAKAIRAGLVWAFLTIAFESLLGYFVSNLTPEQIVGEYNIIGGKLWSLVIIALMVTPVALYRIRNNIDSSTEIRKA